MWQNEFQDFGPTFDTDLSTVHDAFSYTTRFFEDSTLSNDSKQRLQQRQCDHLLLTFLSSKHNITSSVTSYLSLLRYCSFDCRYTSHNSSDPIINQYFRSIGLRYTHRRCTHRCQTRCTTAQQSTRYVIASGINYLPHCVLRLCICGITESDVVWRAVLQSYRQTVAMRYRILRDFLLFFGYAVYSRVKIGTAPKDLETDVLFYLQNEAIPRILSLLKSYRLLLWIAQITRHTSIDIVKAAQTESEMETGVSAIELPVAASSSATSSKDAKDSSKLVKDGSYLCCVAFLLC